jgi:hypothetical protein
LSFPVDAHWATNCCCERLTMKSVVSRAAGTASRETTARIGLISSIMISTPTIVRSEVMSWVRLCWSDWPMLSMSLVTRLRVSPRGWPSK